MKISISKLAELGLSKLIQQLAKLGKIEGIAIIIPDHMGDRVAEILKPVARSIDSVFGTDLQNCEGCAERQERLNSMFQNKPKE